jgi:hypothetical protein
MVGSVQGDCSKVVGNLTIAGCFMSGIIIAFTVSSRHRIFQERG